MHVGPAPDGVTNQIFELTKSISNYSIVADLKCPIDKIGVHTFDVSFKCILHL